LLTAIALDIKFCCNYFFDSSYIGITDMAFIGPRMDGQPIGAGLMRDTRECQQIGDTGVPRIAQQRDLVEIDAEPCHGRHP
jgi:hypothetical protein